MQPLARDGYTDEQVRAVLLADNIDVRGGAELVDLNGRTLQDLTDSLVGGSVTRTMYADVHGACTLRLTTPLAWGWALVRPFLTVSGLGRSCRFDLGVYVLTTPDDEAESSVTTYNVQGRDLLHLLMRPVARDYTVVSNAGYLTAMRQVLVDAGIPPGMVLLDGSASDKVLPAAKTWPLLAEDSSQTTTTWLRIFNDLAAAINYQGIWTDYVGRYRSGPYVVPSARASEFTFDADAQDGIVGKRRTRKQDYTDTPNRWQFIQQNRPDGAPAPSVGDGIYEFTNQSTGPASLDARGGFDWTKVVYVDAADQETLQARAAVTIAADQDVAQTFEVTTGPFPAAGHFDVFTYQDSKFGRFKVQATRWEIPDLGGGDTTWTWRVV